MDTKNYDAVDISKLILSLMVVALHTSFLEGFANPILRLAVPIFFIYSGFFFFYKDSQVNEENKPLKKLVVRNVKLYAAWFLVLLLPTNYLKSYFDSVGGGVKVTLLLKDFFLGSTWPTSWYIMATVIGIIAIRFLNKYLNDAIIFAVALLFYLICLFSTNYSFMVEEGGAVKKLIDLLGAPQNNFCVSLIWLMCGKTVAKYRLHEKWKTRSILIGLTVALSLLLIEHFELKIFGVWSDTLNDCYIFSVPVAFLIAISILSRNDVIKNGMLLRRMSTVIYCSHFFIAIFVKKLVLILQVPNLLNCTVYFITVIICVVLAYTVVYVGKYIKVLRLLY